MSSPKRAHGKMLSAPRCADWKLNWPFLRVFQIQEGYLARNGRFIDKNEGASASGKHGIGSEPDVTLHRDLPGSQIPNLNLLVLWGGHDEEPAIRSECGEEDFT